MGWSVHLSGRTLVNWPELYVCNQQVDPGGKSTQGKTAVHSTSDYKYKPSLALIGSYRSPRRSALCPNSPMPSDCSV